LQESFERGQLHWRQPIDKSIHVAGVGFHSHPFSLLNRYSLITAER
jgi:hypothetical protein